MLHVKSARCVARDLHKIAPGPLERACWRQFAALRGDCKKSRIAPLNAIIIIIIIKVLYRLGFPIESAKVLYRLGFPTEAAMVLYRPGFSIESTRSFTDLDFL